MTGSFRARRAVFAAALVVACSLLWGAGSTPAYAFAGGDPLVLNILWRIGTTDRMTTVQQGELQLGLPLEEAVAYVPAGSGPGRTALNRYYKSSTPGDHRECTCPSLAGYNGEGTLGFPFTSTADIPDGARVGLMSGASGSDYATYAAGKAPAGYVDSAAMGFGYRRYGLANEDLLGLTVGDVSIASNRVAGGALWSWKQGGVEYVDNSDYGRLIQSGIFFSDTSSDRLFGPERLANPTEAGDMYSWDQSYGKRHGSPTVTAVNTSATQQTTMAIPLEWRPDRPWFGGGPDHPVLWRDMRIGKNIELNYRSLGSSVARYTTQVTVARDIVPYDYNDLFYRGKPDRIPTVEVPSIYMPTRFGSFFTYEPGAVGGPKLTAVSPPAGSNAAANDGMSFMPKSQRGGVIVADSADPTSSHAMGLFGIMPYAPGGGPVSEFKLYDGRAVTDHDPFVKINALATGTIRAGTTNFTTYVVTGSLASVTAAMDQLNALSVAGQLN